MGFEGRGRSEGKAEQGKQFPFCQEKCSLAYWILDF
jgi:endogenous inhibitor of DNA gyrase (YacG/DUF329 family)